MKNWMKRTTALITVLVLVLIASAGVFAAPDSTVDSGRKAAREYYSTYKTLDSYWNVFAAYSAYGTTYLKDNGYTYNASTDDVKQPGAKALAVMMIGGDPFNYNGKNLMATVIAKATESTAYSAPVFNLLALHAAGVPIDSITEEALVDYCCDQLTNADSGDKDSGPDIGGWAIVALTYYLDNSAYKDDINAALTDYLSYVSAKMTTVPMGTVALSSGCVVTGLTALTAAGLDGYDATTDDPWKANGLLTAMSEGLANSGILSAYNCQYYMEFCDLYNVLYNDGQPAWLSCGVSASKLASLKTQANALLAAKSSYTSISIEQLQTALNAANALTTTQLNQKIPTWGETYYALYYAVNNCKAKGNPAVMTDLDSSQWYMPFVKGVVEEGLMNGTSNATFAPNNNLSRAMMVQILYNMAGRPSYSIANPFSDVKDNDWFAPAVLWASENGITTGTTATTFDPNKDVTREQLAAFICRFAPKIGITLPSGGNAFADDSAIESYFKANVYSLVGAGIVSGVGNNKFAPKDTATRAQVAKMIYLLTQLKEG